LLYSNFDAKRDLSVADSINMAQAAYMEIADEYTELSTASGQILTIGDILYLYNVITSRN